MKKNIKFFAVIVVFAIFSRGIFAENTESSFALSPALDIPLLAGSAALVGTDAILKNLDAFDKDFTGVGDKDDVNAFDRFFMQKYSSSISTVSEVTRALCYASPLVLTFSYGFSSFRPHFNYIVMYGETVLLTWGITDIIKAVVCRNRPYSYFDSDMPQKKIDDGDWCKSFPSGHTSGVFAAAAFTSYVFCTEFSDSPWKVPVIATTCTVATATAVLRVASGNHFVTDVLVGSLIGSACGIAVPLFHQILAKNKAQGDAKKSGVEISLLPMGFCVSKKF